MKIRSATNKERLLGCELTHNCAEIRTEIDAGSRAVDEFVVSLPDGKASDIFSQLTGIGGDNTSDWTLAGQLHLDDTANMYWNDNPNWAGSFGQYLDQSGFNPFSINVPGLVPNAVSGGKNTTAVGYVDVFNGNPGRPKTNEVTFDTTKFKYFFGDVALDDHNTPRANQRATAMKRLGFANDEASRNVLAEHFKSVPENVGSLAKIFSNEFCNFESRESILFGPSNKAVMFFSTYEVLPDGVRRFITTIPKGMTKQ